jgi:hypothetical protein
MASDPSPSAQANRPGRRIRLRPVVLLVLTALLIGGYFWWSRSSESYEPPPLSFDGPSDRLEQTVVVPTLDTPMPAGKSVVWCSSFQLAWNQLRDDIIKEPIRIRNADAVAERLNRATQSAADLSPESYYAAAGFGRDGIVERISGEMSRRFPGRPVPPLQAGPQDIVAYAHLEAGADYTHPFFDNPDEFRFRDSGGRETSVSSFGLFKEHAHGYEAVQQQVEVLFDSPLGADHGAREFALDLCKDSQPYQVVLAHVEPQGTLAATLEHLGRRIASPGWQEKALFWPGVSLLLTVPSMHWRVSHHFQELEGEERPILNTSFAEKYHLAEAVQVLQFRMDRKGAGMKSTAWMGAKDAWRPFPFDRPFLVYLKKRDAAHPFFVMWVDNAELLQRR